MKPYLPVVLLSLLLVGSCKTPRQTAAPADDGKLEVIFMQVNDVYEIAPLAGGKEGGLARVASLKKNYQRTNPNTLLVMAGDFLSPSVYNSLPYEGKPIRGRQMVDALNAAGLDIAVFGNHEFDIKENELQERLNESKFQWVASNTFHQTPTGAAPFVKTHNNIPQPLPTTAIIPFRDQDGTQVKVGIIGITLPYNTANFVSYTDPLATAKKLYLQLKDSVDAVIAVTHQLVADDKILATEIPGLAAILGGHEHDSRQVNVGNVVITKAHANAKSAYLVKLQIDKNAKTVRATPQLEYLNENIPLDSTTHRVVQKWTDIAAANYQQLGFNASKIVLAQGEPLDGRESEIRHHPTNLTRLVTAAMAAAAPQADVVLVNSGSIRVDDVLPMPVTQYDIIRSMPFGGGIREVNMKGSLLQQTLTQGQKNQGNGGYLLYNEAVTFDQKTNTWQVKKRPIQPNAIYRVALSDFLLTGKETNLNFLNPQNPGITKELTPKYTPAHPMSDIRLTIVKYLEQK